MQTFQTILVVVFIIFSASGCGKKEPAPSNIPETNETAENEMKARLVKTESIRRQVRNLTSSLAPVDAILTDVSGALNTRVSFDGGAKPQVEEFLKLLQRVLREATEGIVTHHSDGSWSMVREVNLINLGSSAKCPKVNVKFEGRRVGNAEQLTVKAKDCSLEQTEQTIAVLSEIAGNQLDAKIHPEVLKHFFNGDFKQGQCDIAISKDITKVICKPFESRLGTVLFKMDILTFEKTAAGITASAHATVLGKENKLLAEANVIAQPGKKTEVTVKTY